MCILELSKATMYEFLYDHIENKYGNKSKFLFADTHSLMHEIETENYYDNFCDNIEMFEVSTYSAKSK